MDVVLGVAVTGRVARLAMIGSPASGGQLLDQYALELSDDALTELADTIIGTYQAVTESGNQVAATRLCLPDPVEADTLRLTVSNAGVPNVGVVAEAEAAAALARSAGADAALLVADDDTASLTVIGEAAEGPTTSTLASVPIGTAGVAAACATVLQQAAGEAPTRVMLVGQRLDLDSVAAELRSMAPVEVPPDAGFAIARGAAQTTGGFTPAGAATQMAPALDATQMAPAATDSTQMAPSLDATQMAPAAADATQMAPAATDATVATPTDAAGQVGPELAYSQEPEPEPWAGYDEMPMDPLSEFVPEQAEEAGYTTVIAPPPPRMLLVGSALTFVAVSFATLAVTVAINVRPAADVRAQPVTPTQSDTVPGRYLPPVPHEPDPVALPVTVLTPPPAQPVAPNTRTGNDTQPAPQAPPATQPPPAAPAPQAPAPQAPAPAPIPVPVPPVIVIPPLTPPWTPPWATSTFPTTPPTSTTTPPTTTPPTTTTEPTTTVPTTTVPTTTVPSTSSEPTTTSAPAPTTTYTPPVEEPTYTAPVEEPAYTPPVEQPSTTVYPDSPSWGDSSSGGGSSSSGGSSSDDSSSGGSYGGGSEDAPVTTVFDSP
ncbi:hypothetical protein [Mycolicibacterium goodii]|uniref:DUF7159 domain-containing protein n=1 Tax=Mycolicibacterium goodii TaxID=134601 RepID=A0A0K0XHF1_MYCGD|nr:hypothetical protein AFA91_32805 [Mycolicibacterium goodii]